MVRQIVVLICSGAILVFMLGCTVLHFNEFSSPSPSEHIKPCGFGVKVESVFNPSPPTKLGEKINDNCVWLDVPGLDISIRPMNIVTTRELMGLWPLPPFIPTGGYDPQKVKGPFWLELRFDPKGGEVKFNSMRITLQTEDGTNLTPSHISRPVMVTAFPGAEKIQLRRRYPCAVSEVSQVTGETISIDHISCLWLIYDFTPIPTKVFVISLDEITRDGKSYTLSPIKFEKGADWFLYSIP